MPTPAAGRVLLIASPDRLLRHRLVADAAADNRDVTSVASCADLVQAIGTCGHALVVLDDRLVEANLCGLVQEVTRHGPGVLVLTSDGSELNVVLLMELGADDVVVRPFSLRELNARIRAILRRRLPAALADPIDGPIRLNEESRLVTLNGRQLHIPRLEFAVLHALQARHGEPVPRAVLLDECWPCTAVRRPEYVNAVIRRLRLRLEERPSNPKHVVMVRGKGYALRA